MREEDIEVGSELYVKDSVIRDSGCCVVIKSIKYRGKDRPTRYYVEGSGYSHDYFRANELVPISCEDLPRCSECPY